MGRQEFYRAEDGSIISFEETVGWKWTDNNSNVLFNIDLTGQTTVQGPSAGTAITIMPLKAAYYKKFLVYLNGYKNGSSVAQTITFPTAFLHTPKLVVDDTSGASVSTTTLTLPASMGAAVTGWIIIEGF